MAVSVKNTEMLASAKGGNLPSPVSLQWDWGIVLFARPAQYYCFVVYVLKHVVFFGFLYENQAHNIKG